MKVAVLCLCLISIVAAWPVSKSKQHAVSGSSEEKYDPRSHHSHRQHHKHVNSQSWESLQHTQNDLAQQTLHSSEESVDVPVQPRFPVVSSKSHEDVDDDDDDTDESDEVDDGFPTDVPVTVPFSPFTRGDSAGRGDSDGRGDSAGRGDSVAYAVRAKATVVKSSKIRKAAKQVIVYDATEEDESALDADSRQGHLSQEDLSARRSLGKLSITGEWAAKGHRQDSSELDSKLRDRSVENDSRQKFDSRETEGDDDSKAGVRGDSHWSVESRESQARVLPEIPDENSNQTLESTEDAQDRHSIENNEVTL